MNNFVEKDLDFYNKFVNILKDKCKFSDMSLKDIAEMNICLQWFNSLYKKIEDNILELKNTGAMPDTEVKTDKKAKKKAE